MHELRAISASQSHERHVRKLPLDGKKNHNQVQSRLVAKELEIDFYNQWGKSAKDLRLRDPSVGVSRGNSKSNSECTFKDKAQTSIP